jgi:hypothetical protein
MFGLLKAIEVILLLPVGVHIMVSPGYAIALSGCAPFGVSVILTGCVGIVFLIKWFNK